MYTLGILREEKQPFDSRVALVPSDCKKIIEQYGYKIYIQPSNERCFSNQEFEDNGVIVQENIFDCDLLLGVKEIPIHYLIPNKRYIFFSHTIKKQQHNLKLIQAIINNKIELIDYEAIVDENDKRLVAFGFWAGFIGCYNALWAVQKRFNNIEMPRLYKNGIEQADKDKLENLNFKNLKFLVTGTGKVATGVIEILKRTNIKEVSPQEFLEKEFDFAVYTQLSSKDMYDIKMANKEFNREEFFEKPNLYKSIFEPYCYQTDVLINAMYWDQRAPKLFTLKEMKKNEFRIKIISDITCDISPEASIPSTLRTTTIENPIFGFLPLREKITEPFTKNAIDVLSIPNLPNELPRDASTEFSNKLTEFFIPNVFDKNNPIVKKATVTKNGELTEDFLYLESYVYDDEFRALHIN